MNAAEAAQGLRELADWVEQHGCDDYFESLAGDGIQVGNGMDTMFWRLGDKDAMAKAVRALGSGEKRVIGEDLHVERKFGPITVSAYTARENVCKRVVTGVKVLPATVVPAQAEQVLPEREIEVVEWVCSPILGDTSDGESLLLAEVGAVTGFES